MGYKGAVVVDFRCAQTMIDNNIPLGNVGHLVQTLKSKLKSFIAYGVEVFTVFTKEKMHEINEAAQSVDKIQDIIVKVSSED